MLRFLSCIIFICISILGSSAADTADMALVNVSVANIRSKPAHSAELASQVVMGTPVKVVATDGSWRNVETPEGYLGWIHRSSLTGLTPKQFDDWRVSRRVVVTSIYEVRCYAQPCESGPRTVVSDLVNGCIVNVVSDSLVCGRLEIVLPDGRRAWVDGDAVEPFETWVTQPYSSEKIVNMALSMMGQPYLWGGTSTKSVDCSGLTKICHYANAIILRRDASQQAQTGQRISDIGSLQRGDLMFFGNATTGKVTHVAIYDADGRYVHSSQRVKTNRVNPSDGHFKSIDYLHSVRIDGAIGSDGIVRVKDHPWYLKNESNSHK